MRPGFTLAATFCLAACLACAQSPVLSDAPITTFGVTVVDPFGLKGEIYLLPATTEWLPNFEKLKPVGAIYTSALNIPVRSFRTGFPGVTDRFEWFAIDYHGYFYVDAPGKFGFALASDDGSKLYIDGKTVIDDDGIHPMLAKEGSITLKGGIHRIRVSYFQGPAEGVGLVLAVARPGEPWRIFSTNEFRPPRNPADWKYGDPDSLPGSEPPGKRKK